MAKKAPKPPKRPVPDAGNVMKRVRPPHPGETEVIAERRARAFGLRKAGASYRQIAAQMGVSLHTAWDDVNAELLELRTLTQKDAEEVRDLELHRCDEMILGLWPHVRNGNDKAVQAAVRVMERRARLLGLDAPTKVDQSIQGMRPLIVDRVTTRAEMLAAVGSGDAEAGPDTDE